MLAPAIAWQTTSQALPARTKMLTIAGLNVAAPVGSGNGVGVEPKSVEVVEAAAGNASRMKFTITDPLGTIAMQALDPVVFWDLVRDMPIFLGWVQRSPTRGFGPTGRLIDVECIGIEAILDWLYVPTFTIPSSVGMLSAIQAIISAAVGWNGVQLRWAMDLVGGGGSNVQYPIEAFGTDLSFATMGVGAYTVPNGTLRQVLGPYLDYMMSVFGNGGANLAWWISVDFYGGIRAWSYDPGTDPRGGVWSGGPADFGADMVDIKPAGPQRPSGTVYEIDSGSQPRTAVVTGAAGVVSVVPDGTGLPGPTITRTDSNLTTRDQRVAVGQAMLAANGGGDQGATTIEGTITLGTFANQNRPGSFVGITDPGAGIPTQIATWAGDIHKTFANSGEETWRIQFGSKRSRTATALLRRLAQGALA